MKKVFQKLSDIDTSIDEGKILLAALGQLSREWSRMHPDNILKECVKSAESMYPKKKAV